MMSTENSAVSGKRRRTIAIPYFVLLPFMFRIINLFFLLLLATNCLAQTTTQSKRVVKPVTIDGNAQEWINPFSLYEAKTQLMFAIANDDSTLYLCFQCPDMVNQDKIMKAGMEVSILRKGKNKMDASIQFPLKKNVKGEKTEDIYVENLGGIDGIKSNFLLNNYVMLTNGFATQNGTFPMKESKGILIAMNWDITNTLVYEMAIPLYELFGNGFTTEELTKELILGVEIFAVERPADMDNANLSSLNTNNAASVVNGGGMQTYGGMGNGTGGGMQNTGSMDGMNSMNGMNNGMGGIGMNGYPNNSMAGMNGMQNNGAGWDGSTTPQYRDISGMFERTEMKQKFLLSVAP